MGIIVDLYRGDIHPADQLGKNSGHYRDLRERLYRSCETLERNLMDDQQADLTHMIDLIGETLIAAEESGFNAGFIIAGRIIMEIKH